MSEVNIILKVYGFKPISIIVNKSWKSLLADLSRHLSSPLYVEVYKYPVSDYYVVLAYTSDANLCKYLKYVKSKYNYKILGESCSVELNSAYFIALKSKCEFFEILERNHAIVLLPYTFRKGRRIFDVLIYKDFLDSFISDLEKHYGSRNFIYKYMKSVDLARRLYASLSKMEHLLTNLTSNELKILKIAIDKGYFNIPRSINLEKLSYEVGLSKVTVEMHLRKALNKIIRSLKDLGIL